MSIVGKNRKNTRVTCGGDTYPKLKDSVYGYRRDKINKKSSSFSNDYIYTYPDNNDDDCSSDVDVDFEDKEAGVNCCYPYIDDPFCNNHKKNDRSSSEKRSRLWYLIKKYGDIFSGE